MVLHQKQNSFARPKSYGSLDSLFDVPDDIIGVLDVVRDASIYMKDLKRCRKVFSNETSAA